MLKSVQNHQIMYSEFVQELYSTFTFQIQLLATSCRLICLHESLAMHMVGD